jgi:hypothetical protein
MKKIRESTVAAEHITACICTYKRPALLTKLLSELQNEDTEGLFTYLL